MERIQKEWLLQIMEIKKSYFWRRRHVKHPPKKKIIETGSLAGGKRMEESMPLTPEKTANELIWSTQHPGMWEKAREAGCTQKQKRMLLLGHGEGKWVGRTRSPHVSGLFVGRLVYFAKLSLGDLWAYSGKTKQREENTAHPPPVGSKATPGRWTGGFHQPAGTKSMLGDRENTGQVSRVV